MLRRTVLAAVRAAAVALAAAVAVPASATARQVTWETNLGKAAEAARKANKPMLLEFWSVTCEPCKVLDETVFPDERIGSAIKKLQTVRVDVDKQPDVARKYHVNGTPTLLLTDSYGTELFRYTGLLPADRLLQLLDELPSNVARFNELSLALSRNKDDFTALTALGRELRSAGFYRASNRHLDRALRAPGAPAQRAEQATILIAMARNYFAVKEFDRSAQMFARYLRQFPGGTAEPEVMLGLGYALLSQNKNAEARKILQTLTEKHRDSRAAADAAKLLIKQP
jgi:thioredoxin-like negative regulator of GroEL